MSRAQRWLLQRILQALLTLLIALTIIFVLMRLTPGDPIVNFRDEQSITPEQLRHLREMYGLNQPIVTQFFHFLSGVLRGDLGISYRYTGQPVTRLLLSRIPWSLLLGGSVLLINFTLGLWLGVRQAIAQGRPLDRILTVVSLTGYAMPSFWLGLVLAWLFAIHWHLLPVAGPRTPTLPEDAGAVVRALDVVRHLLLPAFTLSLVSIAATMRQQRSALLEVLPLDFIRAARTRGLPERRVIWRHAWRNALVPVLTLFGLWLPILATGAVFVESVFAWPGLGQLGAEAIGNRDYPLIMGTAILVAFLVVLGGLLTDLAYLAVDPRIRLQE